MTKAIIDRLKYICIVMIVFLLFAAKANAENVYKETALRCEKGIISIGDPEVMLFSKCGQPIYIRHESYRKIAMTYAKDGMYRVVTIKDGEVLSIVTAGRAN